MMRVMEQQDEAPPSPAGPADRRDQLRLIPLVDDDEVGVLE
jgi:hypothetical protein